MYRSAHAVPSRHRWLSKLSTAVSVIQILLVTIALVPMFLAIASNMAQRAGDARGGDGWLPASSPSTSTNGDKIIDRPNSIRVPILDLVNTHPETKCPDGLFLVADSVSKNISKKRIPQTVHVTSRSRCVTREFYDNLQKWKLDGHSFFLHNDGATDRLLQRHWPEFPHLQKVVHCLVSGAAKADLWRALILWEYGGIYTDIDNAPTDEFKARNYIGEEDQAFFVIDWGGFLSQFFFAAEPRHPMTYMIVQHTLLRLLGLNNVFNQYVPYVTGPGAVKSAFIGFMSDTDTVRLGKVSQPGVYTGMGNTTVKVLGTAIKPGQYVARDVIAKKKDFTAR